MALLEQGEVGPDDPQGPFRLQPFCDSVIELPHALMCVTPDWLCSVFLLFEKKFKSGFCVTKRPTAEVSGVGVSVLGPCFGKGFEFCC